MTQSEISRPEFRLLSEKQLVELHAGSLQILETTGVTVHCEEALALLADAGADISDPKRVKIPKRLVEEALKTKSERITLYTREGDPYVYLDLKHTYFGAVTDCPEALDPYTKKRRPCYVEDTAATARLIDHLPNLSFLFTTGFAHGLPGEITDKVSLVQAVLNSSKPVGPCINDVESLESMLEVCSVVSGGLEKLKEKPFFYCTVEPVTPLVHGKEALEKSLLCAELGIPNVIYSMTMAGASTPATFAATLAVCNAEFLSHFTITQLKNPGAPVIYGNMPNIMDMRTAICPYGSPELSFLVGCITELSHFYGFPIWGTAGCTDSKVIGVQAGTELMYQCITSTLSGADFVHDTGLMDHATMTSPELIVLMDEIIDSVKVLTGGIEISEKTLALDLIEKIGPSGNYMAEDHTLEHFKNFWFPTLADRTRLSNDQDSASVKHAEDLLNEKTRTILETHQPKLLPGEVIAEIKRIEESWFKKSGLSYEYPERQV